jgi:hypothetical protein
MATLTEILAALIAPDQTLQASDLKTTWQDNPTALRLGASGASPLAVAVAHDHGAARGTTLDRALLSLSFGPHAAEGTADVVELGAPLFQATSGSFAATPKLMASAKLDLPGGVGALYADLLLDFAGAASRSITITVEVRPLTETGFGPGAGTGIGSATTISEVGGAFAPFFRREEFAFTQAEVATLGDIGRDRELEVCVWLGGQPQASANNRLLSLTVYPGAAPALLPAGDGLSAPSLVTVTSQEIHAGEVLTENLAGNAKMRINQDTLGIVGTTPGAALNDSELGWRTRVRGAHQHRGRRAVHPYTGEIEPDGACLRYGGWSQHLGGDYGDTTTPSNAMGVDAYQGLRVHSGADLGATWIVIEGRCSIPVGLGALDVTFALQPGTTAQTPRLYLYVHLGADLAENLSDGVASETNLITGLSSGVHVEDASLSRSSEAEYRRIQVDPIDTPIWRRNAVRLASGLGLWTLDAKLPALIPAFPEGATTTNAYRVSQPVRCYLTVPATGDYRLRLRWALQEAPADVAAMTAGTRLCWVGCVPAPGY